MGIDECLSAYKNWRVNHDRPGNMSLTEAAFRAGWDAKLQTMREMGTNDFIEKILAAYILDPVDVRQAVQELERAMLYYKPLPEPPEGE